MIDGNNQQTTKFLKILNGATFSGRPWVKKNDPGARPEKNFVTRVIVFRVIFFVTRAMARDFLTRATALSRIRTQKEEQ